MNVIDCINGNKTALGIEFGSTRIKAVLIGDKHQVLASGEYCWENKFVDNLWTYSLEDIWTGLRACYVAIKKDIADKYGIILHNVGAIGISGMMHGYMAFDESGELLVPFRTWRNNYAETAAKELTELFNYSIPARWSIAHLYQAIKNGEPHIKDIAYQTTLAGYIHWKLTGKRVLGVGEASGMFPINIETKQFNKKLLGIFDETVCNKVGWKLADILPEVLVSGVGAGALTVDGAKLLDPAGDLNAGIPFCPPEGDAGTGMIATNSIKAGTGNISAGTSIFAMTVLEKELSRVYPELDIVTTPDGKLVAMAHGNNCTSEINAWIKVFDELLRLTGAATDKGKLYENLFTKALEGTPDCGDLIVYNYLSNENITNIAEGRPMFLRTTESDFSLANFMRAQIYSAFAVLKIGQDILFRDEGVSVSNMYAHGGIFKTKGVAQNFLAAALNVPITVNETANEGGPWGMAVLAMFMLSGGKELDKYLSDKVFAEAKSKTVVPNKKDVIGFKAFMDNYIRALPAVRKAVTALSRIAVEKQENALNELKEKVFKANLNLVKHGLVIFTWGNASAIDRERGLVVIKPSGVDYGSMKAEDMVVVDMNGNVVEGKLRPSSDLPTHLEIYKAFPQIGGITHTHSTFATAWAQAGKDIPFYGTTHADYFYGSIPCARALTKKEIENDYEKNTGIVIAERFNDADPLAVPAVLVKNHGTFSFGKDADSAVHNAVVCEEVAKMAYLTESINPQVKTADKYLLEKHYNRKHGKNAYYGQK